MQLCQDEAHIQEGPSEAEGPILHRGGPQGRVQELFHGGHVVRILPAQARGQPRRQRHHSLHVRARNLRMAGGPNGHAPWKSGSWNDMPCSRLHLLK